MSSAASGGFFEVLRFFFPPHIFHPFSKLSIYHSLGPRLLCVIRLKVILMEFKSVRISVARRGQMIFHGIEVERLWKTSCQVLVLITKVKFWVYAHLHDLITTPKSTFVDFLVNFRMLNILRAMKFIIWLNVILPDINAQFIQQQCW